jgi:type III restriction enzyme
MFPETFNSWEGTVLLVELKRDGNVAWYRNPARASQDSLGVVYEHGDETKIVRPDFIFFTRLPDGTIAADIIDPHGPHLGDALPRLRGLSRYAETHHTVFRRIEVLAAIGGAYRLLDLTEPSVREAIQRAESAKDLFQSGEATDYDLGAPTI